MRRLADALLTTEPQMRVRLSQALLSIALMGAGVLTVHWFAWTGVAATRWLWPWTVVSFGGIVGGYFLVRSGRTQGRADPSLTVPMMLFAVACSTWSYAFLGAGRGAVFPVVMVTLVFGMFVTTPRQIAWVCGATIGMLGLTMTALALTRPVAHPAVVELGHFLIVATTLPALALLAVRLARMRERSRRQRLELTAALARIRELATHDELTGLVNRRHLQGLMDQEHQRCIRSGHTFCLAGFEVEGLDALPTAGARDALLREVAEEAQRYVRVADVLGRWDGQRFVLLMPDTRATLARGGIERLRDRVAQARLAEGRRVTLVAGLAEHRAGESVAQTLARVEAALAEGREGRAAPASTAGHGAV